MWAFLPSAGDISHTCWRYSHLHKSYTYYIVPTCRLRRETSSSVGGSNCKLRVSVTWHHAVVIIYVHRIVVFWPRGHLIHLWQFRLYNARRVEALLQPSNANSNMFQEILLPVKDSGRLNHGWPSCWRIQRVYPQTEQKKKIIRGHLEENRPSFRFSLCAPPPAAGQGGRETLTWPPVKRACQNLLGFRGGTNPEERETLWLCSMRPCANWTGPVRNLDGHGLAEQQESREGEKVRDAVGIERVCEVSPSHRVF